MTSLDTPRKLAYQDLLALPDDLFRHEIIDGEHFVMAAPALRHQHIVLNLALLLAGFIRRRQLGTLLLSPVDVLLSDHDVVEPDLLFVSRERSGRIAERFVNGAPDLVIEVISPATRKRDEGVKRRLYQKHGVLEYWLIDPETGTIQVSSASRGWFAPPVWLSVAAADLLASPLLPGLEIPLAGIFEQPPQ